MLLSQLAVKNKLASLTSPRRTPRRSGRGCKNGAASDFIEALQRQLEHCEKWMKIAGDHIKKNYRYI